MFVSFKSYVMLSKFELEVPSGGFIYPDNPPILKLNGCTPWEGTANWEWECDTWMITTSNTSASDTATFSIQEVK